MAQVLSGNINSFNNTFNFLSTSFHFTTADDKSKILAWCSPLEPQVRHQDIRNQRVGGIGSWLLETKEFGNWCGGSGEGGSDHAALFCYGDPGVGKSYIR